MYPAIARQQKDDVHGIGARLNAIQTVLAGRKLGAITDLGGNAGYFCLSLLDSGMATSATVYDVLSETLAAGRTMARALGIAEKIKYVERKIDLSFVHEMPEVDTIICLNLLHHSGRLFDVELVRDKGWGQYAGEWLTAIRGKSRLAVIGLAFDNESPPNWDEPAASRAQRFAGIAEKSGWSILYYANVKELERVGVEAAKGRFRPPLDSILDAALKSGSKAADIFPLRSAKRALKQVMRRMNILPKIHNRTGSMGIYHFYILEIR
jgi:hypothetical protein